MLDSTTALRLIQGKPWHHDFEIIPGVRTNGSYNPAAMWNELQLPEDLSGTSLADVGASNGFFSFEARRRGARVVAFDTRHKDNSGFGLAQYINGLADIEHHHINVLDIDAAVFGQFDVVLALGLFYHTSDPYRALSNCAALARTRLFVESYCVDSRLPQEMQRDAIAQFYSDPDRFPEHHLGGDRSNFWGFTSTCLRRMLEDLWFTIGRLSVRGDRVFIDAERAVVTLPQPRQAFAYGCRQRVALGPNPDDPASWTIF